MELIFNNISFMDKRDLCFTELYEGFQRNLLEVTFVLSTLGPKVDKNMSPQADFFEIPHG